MCAVRRSLWGPPGRPFLAPEATCDPWGRGPSPFFTSSVVALRRPPVSLLHIRGPLSSRGVGGVRGHLPSRGQLTSNHGSISASIPLRQPSAAGFRGAAASESWTALAGRRSAHRARSRKCQESQMKSSLLRVRAVLGVVSNEQTTVFAS